LAYYHANQDEIEAALAADDRTIEALEREQETRLQDASTR
jgi:hypothetical protein